MTDLDSLIREADPARELIVPQVDPAEIRRLAGRPRRSRRRLLDVLAAGVAATIALAVALVVLLAGSHGRPSPAPAAGPSAPAAARPLTRILRVLRRPQTAADRAAESAIRWGRPQLSLVRLAATTPWGERVILAPERAGPSDTLMLIGSFPAPGRLETSVVDGLSVSQIEAGQAWSAADPGTFWLRQGIPMVMVVPDGVARVTFVRTAGPAVTVRVRDNVAFADLTRFCCGVYPVTRWYAPDGRLLKVTGVRRTTPTRGTHSLGPPAINLPPGVVTVARLRLPNGAPFSLTLQRIRFERRQYLCLAVIQGSGTSQACQNPLPLPDRPLVAVMADPAACKPHPVQLVWGLALTDSTVALRAGGRDQVAVRRSIPPQLRARGNVFYVWARSAPDSLLAKTASGKVVETLPINATHVLVSKWACKQLANGGQLFASGIG